MTTTRSPSQYDEDDEDEDEEDDEDRDDVYNPQLDMTSQSPFTFRSCIIIVYQLAQAT